MFKLTLHIGLYDQNLVRKQVNFDVKSDLIYSNIFFIIGTLDILNTKRAYTFLKLCFVFLCSVQAVQCVL